MTACVVEPSAGHMYDGTPRAGCSLTADGAYGARLAGGDGGRYPERWTLDGPEPYAVPLPGNRPEEPDTEVQPMSDGRVLIHRRVGGRHVFALLYPTGPGTGEVPLGGVECPGDGTRLRLLPPAPDGERAYALEIGPRSTSVWLVVGGTFGPEHVAEIPGRCSGGVWLDRTGRILALDREVEGAGGLRVGGVGAGLAGGVGAGMGAGLVGGVGAEVVGGLGGGLVGGAGGALVEGSVGGLVRGPGSGLAGGSGSGPGGGTGRGPGGELAGGPGGAGHQRARVGAGAGGGLGTGSGTGLGSGVGTGPGARPGAGPRSGPGAGPGTGLGPPGIRLGSGPVGDPVGNSVSGTVGRSVGGPARGPMGAAVGGTTGGPVSGSMGGTAGWSISGAVRGRPISRPIGDGAGIGVGWGGVFKTVVVDLERGGEVSPLLQIAVGSDDRLLLADPDSGLLLIRSDAPSPGQRRLGWGVLGSALPVRFPRCLRLPDRVLTPFAIQPGQMLSPERCAVAFRVDGPAGSWVAVWRPAERRTHQFPAPRGWLAGAGWWSADGTLRLPYSTPEQPCAVAALTVPEAPPYDAEPGPPQAAAPRPVPLREAPLARLVTK